MDALGTDNKNDGKDSAGVLINTGAGVVIVFGSGAMIASGAGAVSATGGVGAVNAAGAGSVNAAGVLAAQGTAKYDSCSLPAAADTFTFFGWTLARSASGQVPQPTSNNKMSNFLGMVVDVAVRVSHKKQRRRRFGLGRVVDACAKRLGSCTRGSSA